MAEWTDGSLCERHNKARLELAKKHLKDSQDCEKQDFLVWWNPRLNRLASQSVSTGGNQVLLITCPIPSQRWRMVVAASCCDGLVRDEGKLNRAKYRDILNENLVQSTQNLRRGRRFNFQQDNDTKHTANTTQEWLRYNCVNVLDILNEISGETWKGLSTDGPHPVLERICRDEWQKSLNLGAQSLLGHSQEVSQL